MGIILTLLVILICYYILYVVLVVDVKSRIYKSGKTQIGVRGGIWN